MDTKAVAEAIGTEPKILRRFLRDPRSTFRAVGSGARYDFTENDIPELSRRFADWAGTKPTRPTIPRVSTPDRQRERDAEVWAEEGPVVIADIRDPRVRARVRSIAAAQEARLNERLMAAGMHISQQRRVAV